jgi:hypothetical protein
MYTYQTASDTDLLDAYLALPSRQWDETYESEQACRAARRADVSGDAAAVVALFPADPTLTAGLVAAIIASVFLRGRG